MVLTDRGLVRLRGLGNPDGEKWQTLDLRVATDDGPREANRFYVNGAEPVVTVETARGYRVRGTRRHPIRVVDANGDWQWRRFADLRAGDRVPMMLGGMVGEPREVPLPPLPEAYWTSDLRTVVPRYLTADLRGAGRLLHGRWVAPRPWPSLLCHSGRTTTSSTGSRTSAAGSSALRPAVTAKTGYSEVALQSVRLTLWWEACGFADAPAARRAPRQGLRGAHPGRGPLLE